ncbi:uncharacterized protein BDV17DRAFT_299894 [Aspergillus undulatus]|uniref:uncharacterized protein n=1 Tax=Aspergillus undulatus TaxID=1810928 RepID=UPI003CCD21C1
MAPMLETDHRNLPHYTMQQGPEYRETPYTPPPPPPYYLLPNGGCSPAVSYAPYFPQTPLIDPIQHVQHDYDYFVNGVISDVLIRVEDESAYKSPCDDKPVFHNSYSTPQSYLMWGSDAGFGPNGYHPSFSPEVHVDKEHAPLYGIRPVPQTIPTQPPTPVLKTEPEPEPETIQLESQEEQSPELAELSRGGLHKITGKKRRRLLHIIAERNRRMQQNKMYEELYRMVPGLENSSRSTKREVLMRTADWLEELVEGNKKLQQQLRQLS